MNTQKQEKDGGMTTGRTNAKTGKGVWYRGGKEIITGQCTMIILSVSWMIKFRINDAWLQFCRSHGRLPVSVGT